MTATFSHLGITVSDVDRSLRFYCDALGFEEAESYGIGADFAGLMELADVKLRSQYVRKEGTSIELLGFAEPQPVGDGARRPVNRLGINHLSFRVDDIDETVAMITAHGGAEVEGTRTSIDLGGAILEFVYCTDPDGVRIELMDFGATT